MTVTVFVAVASRAELNAGDVGLTIVYVATLSSMFQWIVRQSAEVENQMTGVERILEYASLTPEQSPAQAPDTLDFSAWPQSGSIEFKDLRLRYSDDGVDVLRGLSFR